MTKLTLILMVLILTACDPTTTPTPTPEGQSTIVPISTPIVKAQPSATLSSKSNVTPSATAVLDVWGHAGRAPSDIAADVRKGLLSEEEGYVQAIQNGFMGSLEEWRTFTHSPRSKQ